MREVGWDEFSGWVWAQRELPFAVDAVHLEQSCFLAGDREGGLACWDLEGSLRWNADAGQRVEDFASGRDGEREMMYVTAGLHVIGISSNDGDIIWRQELEGSSEAVLFDSEDDRVVVTSSVYDIEHHAFTEAACWFFSPSGESLGVERFDERAWHLALRGDGVLLGLGRPRGGLLIGDAGDLEYSDLGDSPVTCGHTRGGTSLLGHADGSFTVHGPRGAETRSSGCSIITAVLLAEEGVALVGDQHGMLAAFREDDMLWSVDLDDEVAVLAATSYEGTACIWACTRRAEGSGLFLIAQEDGERLLGSKSSARIRCMSSHGTHILFGLDDGMVLLHEMEMLARRLSLTTDGEQKVDARREEMLGRLRGLRD